VTEVASPQQQQKQHKLLNSCSRPDWLCLDAGIPQPRHAQQQCTEMATIPAAATNVTTVSHNPVEDIPELFDPQMPASGDHWAKAHMGYASSSCHRRHC
jgi:hypothetical protein